MNTNNFQVNVMGMIDLLSNHLYSNPGVFIRELLQNAVDAITARKRLGHPFAEKITVELFPSSRTIAIHDNGIGMNEQEIHTFLSQIGHTSKRLQEDAMDEFIGHFGVGLLSCFIVSNEIVLITRSALEGDALEWRAQPEGTFSLRKLEKEAPIGTTVYLTCKDESCEEYFEYYKVREMLQQYGEFLQTPIVLAEDGDEQIMNDSLPPWKMDRDAAMKFGRNLLYEHCLEVIPLRSLIGEVEGVAYVLPHPVNLHEKKRHKVYVKHMLLSEKMDEILPSWAFFVTCIINTNSLRPTASREAIYENDLFLSIRDELGECMKKHLVRLAATDKPLFEKIIRIHYKSLKQIAAEDDELFQLFIPFLTFETSMGWMTAGEMVEKSRTLLLTTTLDEYRQISRVSDAQQFMAVNGGYVHDFDLIMKLPEAFPGVEVQVVNPTQFFQRFQVLDSEDEALSRSFVIIASEVLERFQCKPVIRWFEPAELPVLYTTNEEISFLRMAEESREHTNALFTEVILTVTEELYDKPYATLCFNFNNSIVRKSVAHPDKSIQRLCIEVLYTQALLLGNYPLNTEELRLMNSSLVAFLNLGLEPRGNERP